VGPGGVKTHTLVLTRNHDISDQVSEVPIPDDFCEAKE